MLDAAAETTPGSISVLAYGVQSDGGLVLARPPLAPR